MACKIDIVISYKYISTAFKSTGIGTKNVVGIYYQIIRFNNLKLSIMIDLK